MRKNLLIALLAVAAAALLASTLHLNKLLRAARQFAGPDPASPAAATAKPAKSASQTRPAPSPATLEAELEMLPKAPAARKPAGDKPAAHADRSSAAPPKAPMAGLAEMLKNPGMKDMIRAQQKASMDLTHASLIQHLELGAEELDTFKDLLVEKQIALMDLGLDLMGGELSDEERGDLVARIAAVTQEYDGKIREFLGNEDFELFQQFEKTQPERMQVQMFKQTMDPAEPLSDEQEHALILAMHEERIGYTFSENFQDQQSFDPAKFTEKAVTKYLEELGGVQERYIVRARDILSEGQLTKYTAALKQQRAMQEMGMKMAVQMFGGAAADGEDDD